jgi:hypothetical protein
MFREVVCCLFDYFIYLFIYFIDRSTIPIKVLSTRKPITVITNENVSKPLRSVAPSIYHDGGNCSPRFLRPSLYVVPFKVHIFFFLFYLFFCM